MVRIQASDPPATSRAPQPALGPPTGTVAAGRSPERRKGQGTLAGHRSPYDRRTPRIAVRRSTGRHRAPRSSVGRTLRTSVLATAAAVGAVATGTFTALAPNLGITPTADAAEDGHHDKNGFVPRLDAMLAAMSSDGTQQSRRLVPTLVPVVADEETAVSVTEHVAAVEKAGRIAAEIAELHRKEAERARIAQLIAKGGLDGWIAEALSILELPQSLAPSVKKIIMKESGGNPNAINLWDSNARRGTPSQGLMQTIPSTFKAYVHPSLADRPITDPVANITAGVRYMVATYGMDTLKRGGRTDRNGNYIGY